MNLGHQIEDEHMQRNVMETVLGAVVLLVAGGFMITALGSGAVEVKAEGYPVTAKFDNINGINAGSDVRIGGIKVGVVSDLALDEQTYQAVATLLVRPETKVPADSSASIVSSGLLGDKFVQIVPGAEETMLAANDTIQFTQSSVSLEELIGKYVFSGGGVEGGKGEATSNDAEAPETTESEPQPNVLPSLE
jgi:phospholipid/cholesterol/gamma-HCH transport system substrate-binding protein